MKRYDMVSWEGDDATERENGEYVKHEVAAKLYEELQHCQNVLHILASSGQVSTDYPNDAKAALRFADEN